MCVCGGGGAASPLAVHHCAGAHSWPLADHGRRGSSEMTRAATRPTGVKVERMLQLVRGRSLRQGDSMHVSEGGQGRSGRVR